jgi:hypothetical protein
VVDASPAVRVECHSGYTYAERPVEFVWDERRYLVERVLNQWRLPDGPGFRVLTTAGEQFELTYSETKDEWSLHGLRPPLIPSSPSTGASQPPNPERKESQTDA